MIRSRLTTTFTQQLRSVDIYIAPQRLTFRSYSSVIEVSDEVKDAILSNKPVVALESTIISHGMPYPRNLEVAKQIEAVIRANGAIPATIAIINGMPKVGLNDDELYLLSTGNSKNSNKKIMKASRRDIAFCTSQRMHAATTVASTMIFAHMAGIKIFATGGIGGVHRGAELTMDISADLYELARTPITVVCAGIKSILDIPKTLEVLETNGVSVVAYNTTEFPAFFTNDSNIKAPLTLNTPVDIARMVKSNRSLNLESGIIVGVPNPSPADTMEIDTAIKTAIKSCEELKVLGAQTTPYILAEVEKITYGKSLDANISLVLNNAKIAAQIACELSLLDSGSGSCKNSRARNQENDRARNQENDVLCIGGAVVDNLLKSKDKLIMRTSNPGTYSSAYGGVARNVAEATAADRTIGTVLLSAVADDDAGHNLLLHAEKNNIDASHVLILPSQSTATSNHNTTATYTAIHDSDGTLSSSIANMDIFYQIDDAYIKSKEYLIKGSLLVLADGNMSIGSFKTLVDMACKYEKTIFFEPTSDHKCTLPMLADRLHCIDIMKPNRSELCTLVNAAIHRGLIIGDVVPELKRAIAVINENDNSNLKFLVLLSKHLHQCMLAKNTASKYINKHLLVSMGKEGILWVRSCHSDVGTSECVHVASEQQQSLGTIDTVNGAGDAFCAGVIVDLISSQKYEKSGRSRSSISQYLNANSIRNGLTYAVKKMQQKI